MKQLNARPNEIHQKACSLHLRVAITPAQRQHSAKARADQHAPEPLKRTPSKFLKHALTYPSIIILTISFVARQRTFHFHLLLNSALPKGKSTIL
jgi:hypothetical protein